MNGEAVFKKTGALSICGTWFLDRGRKTESKTATEILPKISVGVALSVFTTPKRTAKRTREGLVRFFSVRSGENRRRLRTRESGP